MHAPLCMYLLEAGEVDLAGKSHMLSHVKGEVGGRIHTFSVVVTSLRCRLSAKFEADVHSRPRPPLSSLYVVKLKTNSFLYFDEGSRLLFGRSKHRFLSQVSLSTSVYR